MTAHVAKDGLLFLPQRGSRATAAPRRRGVFVGRVGAAVRWVAELPRRRAVLGQLASLSDHELTDIGLARGDLPRVFDPAFTASRNFAGRAGS